MLIAKLLNKQQQKVQRLAAQSRQQHKLLSAHSFLLRQRALSLIGSAPGLALSFSAGVLFQLRHHSSIKAVHSLIGWRWLTTWW